MDEKAAVFSREPMRLICEEIVSGSQAASLSDEDHYEI